VTIPVELFSASRSHHVGLRLLGPDGMPLARRYACSGDDRTLSADEIERGYETEEGKFILVTDEELERLAPRRSRDIELIRFVERDAIDPAYFIHPYLVLPGGEQTKAYRLLAETMESSRRAALASFVMRGKSYAVAIFADRGLLRAMTLRFHDELRAPEGIGGRPTKLDVAQVTRLKRAIAKLAAKDVDEKELLDPDAGALLERARKKLAEGKDVVTAPESDEVDETEAGGGEVIDLFSLVRDRLREPRAKGTKRARRPSAR
jgi:DNA end-binding protein Ku